MELSSRLTTTRPAAIKKAIKAGGFARAWVEVDVDNIPLEGSGKAKREVSELDLGRVGNNRSRLAKLKRRGPTFADPLTTLLCAAILPERQHKHWLAILCTSNKGRRCSLIIVEYTGERRLYVNHGVSLDRWRASVRLLVVGKAI